MSLKLAPPHTKDGRNNESKIDLSNIYSLNRLTDSTTEGGLSITYSVVIIQYLVTKNPSEILNFKVANNIRFEENDDLSNSNRMGEKTSNIFSEVVLTPNDYFNIKYNNSFKKQSTRSKALKI